MNQLLTVFYALLFMATSHSQILDTIRLHNPSFEDTPHCCKPPIGWTDCGDKGETPPDVQPAKDRNDLPFFGVTQKASLGNTYLGMVTREHYTNERVAQRPEKPLLMNHCYSLSIYLCRSEIYLSAVNRNTPLNFVQFTEPIILRIWGGDDICQQKQLLCISPLIENVKWKKYDFQFKAETNLSFFQLEAYYDVKKIFPYNGNLLLDNASDIYEINCDIMSK